MPKSRKRKSRKVKLPLLAIEMLKEQRAAFIRKFGREPGKNDPVFFDPDADAPKKLDPDAVQAEILEAMSKAGTPPQIVLVATSHWFCCWR
jgi:hypothetical protein